MKKKREILFSLLAVLSIALLIYVVMNRGRGHASVAESQWIYNPATKQLTAISSDDGYAPIQLDDGVGYQAMVYTCSSCSDKDSLKVAYVLKFTPEAHDILMNGTYEQKQQVLMNPGSQVAATLEMLEKDQWGSVRAVGDQAMMRLATECGRDFKFCIP